MQYCWCIVALLLHVDVAVKPLNRPRSSSSSSQPQWLPSLLHLFLDLLVDVSAAVLSVHFSAGELCEAALFPQQDGCVCVCVRGVFFKSFIVAIGPTCVQLLTAAWLGDVY